jgi:hypothetical protein
VLILYGAIEEMTQPLVNRVASIIDWGADALGVTLGLTAYWFWVGPWLSQMAPEPDATITEERPRAWQRFSLRTLFVAMTIAAIGCYWMVLPTLNAQRFVGALHEKDYATAERLFALETATFPGDFKNHDHFAANAIVSPLTWDDFWRGERRISVAINYGDDGGLIGCGADISAHREGLKLGMIVP